MALGAAVEGWWGGGWRSLGRAPPLSRARNGSRPTPVALGDAFLACRRELGISQCELARRTGITAGTVHHHESVALLPEPYRGYAASGKLRFKEARTLADLGVYHPRNHHPTPLPPPPPPLF